MHRKITLEVLESFLNCKTKARLSLDGEPGFQSEYCAWVAEQKAKVAKQASERLALEFEQSAVLRNTEITGDLLTSGPPLILDGILQNERYAIQFHALQKVRGQSSLGDFHYVPVLFHECERHGKNQRTLLAILGRLLTDLQGTAPRWGVLLHGHDCQIRRVVIGKSMQGVDAVLRALLELEQKGEPPVVTLNRHCECCTFV